MHFSDITGFLHVPEADFPSSDRTDCFLRHRSKKTELASKYLLVFLLLVVLTSKFQVLGFFLLLLFLREREVNVSP